MNWQVFQSDEWAVAFSDPSACWRATSQRTHGSIRPSRPIDRAVPSAMAVALGQPADWPGKAGTQQTVSAPASHWAATSVAGPFARPPHRDHA